MRTMSRSTMLLWLVLCFGNALPQENPLANDSAGAMIEFPLMDAPFNIQNGYYLPSMEQSSQGSKSFNELSFYALDKSIDKIVRPEKEFFNIMTKKVVKSVWAFTSMYLPLGSGWMHEEYHRAVMWNRDVSSYNEIYDFNLFASSVSVSHESDEDLARLKNNFNADFVRLMEAGLEAQNELVLGLQKDHFYHQIKDRDYHLNYLANLLSNLLYLKVTASDEVNTLVDEGNEKTGKNIEKRDFTGPDFTAWTYDLFRPQELYEQRGVHPSGTGIDRYIKNTDLTAEEQQYLQKQSNLYLLSFLDPSLFMLYGFDIRKYENGEVLKANANIRHYLTSFGHTTNLNVFIKKSDFNLFFTLLNQQNYHTYFPGLDVQVIDFPIKVRQSYWHLSPRIALWLQPQRQSFTASDYQTGGLASAKLRFPFYKTLDAYIEVEGKTKGWVAGNVYLDENLSVRLGFGMRIK